MSLIGVYPLSQQMNDHPEALFTPGACYEVMVENYLCKFKYIRAEDADLVAGDVVYPASADGTEVTRDVSGGSRIGAGAAGVVTCAITHGNWGFIQVGGVGQVNIALNSGDVSAGNFLVGDTSNDGKMKASTAGTDDLYVFGQALAASSASVLAAGAYRILNTM